MNTRVNRVIVIALTLVVLGGCDSASTGGSSRGSQSRREIAEIQRRIVPTQHLFADADLALVRKAVAGYMKAVFPIEVEKPGYLETQMMEWTQWRFPSRTRVSVELENDEDRPNNVVMHVVALKIEPLINEDELRSGRPVSWTWRLQGSRKDVEEVVVGQIVRRYLLLRQGKNPDTVPLEGPIPGLSPKQDGYFKPGASSPGRDR